MLAFTAHLDSLTTVFLPQLFDFVSADVDGATIAIGAASGRDGRAGLEFTVGGNSDNFQYGQYVQKTIATADTQTFGFAINQTATQGTLGGRLLTLVDGNETTFGLTTQVGINIMPDNTLQAVRANAQGTGIILRGLDQGVDAQTTLLGASTDTLSDGDYLEIQVFHHPAAGSITANFYTANVLTSTWSLTNVNTAVSGNNQSTSFCYGGYASTDVIFGARHHEDLAAILSDVYVLNNLTNPSDSRDPTTFIGDRAMVVKFQTDNTATAWTPDPAQANYLNVIDNPPDSATTENTTATLADTDLGDMQPSDATPTEDTYLAYSAYIKNDSPTACGVSDTPADFNALIYMVESTPGTCETGNNDTSVCSLSDAETRRGQTVCTISQNGEAVTFKPNVHTSTGFDGFWVGLSPLDAPPAVWNRAADLPGEFMQLNLAQPPVNMTVNPGSASYDLPWYQPWAGYCYSVEPITGLETAGDYIQFKVDGVGIELDVGFIDHTYNVAADPYSPTVGTMHFRADLVNTPFMFCSENFNYNGESTFSYVDTDTFKIVRDDPDIKFYQNGILIATITPGVMPANIYPYMFAGYWGYASGSYSIRPGIHDAFVQNSTPACLVTSYRYNAVDVASGNDANEYIEAGQWGIGFDFFTGTENWARIMDGGVNRGGGPVKQFQYDENVVCTFTLTAGNVVLTIENWLALDGITDVAGVGTYTYTRPFSQTTDFKWQPNVPVPSQWYRTGLPVWPFEYLQYDFINDGTHQADANLPLRLMIIAAGDSTYALPGLAGINTVSFTFIGGGAASYAGVMNQNTVSRDGTSASTTTDYRYQQSFLASAPDDTTITVNDYNESAHGYKRSE